MGFWVKMPIHQAEELATLRLIDIEFKNKRTSRTSTVRLNYTQVCSERQSKQPFFTLSRRRRLLRLHRNPKIIPLENRKRDERFGLTDGSALFKPHNVTHLELVLRVMRLILLLHPHAPLVLRVWSQPRHFHRHCLVARCAHHASLHRLHGSYPRD